MPLSNVSDPVIREIHRLRQLVRLLALSTAALFTVMLVAGAAALWIRSNDLEDLAHKANSAEVESCYRQASQRASFQAILADKYVPYSVKDSARASLLSTPTVVYCNNLAKRLDTGGER